MAFDEVFSGNGTRAAKTPVRSPRANSYAERFVGTLRRECLDHVVFDDRNLVSCADLVPVMAQRAVLPGFAIQAIGTARMAGCDGTLVAQADSAFCSAAVTAR